MCTELVRSISTYAFLTIFLGALKKAFIKLSKTQVIIMCTLLMNINYL